MSLHFGGVGSILFFGFKSKRRFNHNLNGQINVLGQDSCLQLIMKARSELQYFDSQSIFIIQAFEKETLALHFVSSSGTRQKKTRTRKKGRQRNQSSLGTTTNHRSARVSLFNRDSLIASR